MNLCDARNLANTLMEQHGLSAKGWRFDFNRRKVGFGLCRRHLRHIELSKALVLLNSETDVRDTILHEIAHALVDCGHGHDAVWKQKAVEIGAKPERCYDAAKTVLPVGDYQATCPGCGKVRYRYRRPRFEAACASCCRAHSGGRYDERFKLDYRRVEPDITKPKSVL